MSDRQLSQLRQNVETDGMLTSVPLVYEDDEGSGLFTILSGNHRVLASIEAGLTEIQVMVILTRLSKDRQAAIALSHNAITGQDNEKTLAEIYTSISDVDLREYSGIELPAFDEPKFDDLQVDGPKFHEVTLTFAPDELTALEQTLDRIAKRKNKNKKIVIAYPEFENLFETIVKAKDYSGITNTSTAFSRILELANERLDQIFDNDEEF